MSSRSPWPLALCPLLWGCSVAAPQPDQAHAEAERRCDVELPNYNRREILDPLSTNSPAGGLLNPELSATEGFFALNRPPAAPREIEGYPVEFRLSAHDIVSPGQHLGIGLEIVNRSRGKLTLAHPAVCSHDLMRFPYYDFYVRPDGEQRTYYFTSSAILRCDNVTDSREPPPYFELAPGQNAKAQLEPSEVDQARLLTPGRYVLWAVYRYCAPDAHRPDVLLGEYPSNPVAIEVR